MMKKILTLLALVFTTNSVQSQTLEELFGASEIVVLNVDYYEFEVQMQGGISVKAPKRPIGVSGVVLDLTQNGKIISTFEKTAWDHSSAQLILLILNQAKGICTPTIEQIIVEATTNGGATHAPANLMENLFAFAASRPVYVWGPHEYNMLLGEANFSVCNPFKQHFISIQTLMKSWSDIDVSKVEPGAISGLLIDQGAELTLLQTMNIGEHFTNDASNLKLRDLMMSLLLAANKKIEKE